MSCAYERVKIGIAGDKGWEEVFQVGVGGQEGSP